VLNEVDQHQKGNEDLPPKIDEYEDE